MRMAVVAWMLALALIGCVACDLAGPELAPPPKDPGSVVAHVTDGSGAAMGDVWVYVHDIPNSVGSTFTIGVPTNTSGLARIDAIPAGRRRVEVKPPAGYTVPDMIPIDVVKGDSVTVSFVLSRT